MMCTRTSTPHASYHYYVSGTSCRGAKSRGKPYLGNEEKWKGRIRKREKERERGREKRKDGSGRGKEKMKGERRR